VVNRRKARVQTQVLSCYPASAPINDFVLLFLQPCSPHLTPLAIGSLELSLLVCLLLGGPTRLRPFAPAVDLHQRKSSRNLHLQYSTKSQPTPCCQSLITPRSDHPPVLQRSGPQQGTRGVVCVVFPKSELEFFCPFDLQYTMNCGYYCFHK
jgi:hypothetical protein